MTTQKSNNLESIISVDFSEGSIKIVKKISVPFKRDYAMQRPKVDYADVIGTFAELIIGALKARREACLDMLMRNVDNIIFNDGQQIMFKKNNGQIHSFNVPSYEIMEEAIDLIKKGEIRKMIPAHYDQIAKALYWVEKPADRNGISFGNLISCVTEMIFCGIMKEELKK